VALRKKKDSSMRVAIQQVKDGAAQAAVSAGNTGALMAIARYLLKTLDGIDRPAIATQIPNAKGGATTVLDLGANVDCTAEHLLQFAVMGSALVSVLNNDPQPTVGLLNIGEEAIKGSEEIKRAGELLRAAAHGRPELLGNVEGNDIFKGTADIVVCDGFVGNVALKTTEGLASMIGGFMKEEFSRNLFTKLPPWWPIRCCAQAAWTTAATTARPCWACAGWCSRATARPTRWPSSRPWPARMMRRATSCWTACRAASPMRCPCCNPGRWRRGLIRFQARPMTRRFSRITGTGSYLPARRVTNDDLVAELAQRGIETSDEWIVERTGIHARHFAAPDVGASDLAVPAAQAALQAAGRQASDIDLIIVATSTPDMVFPSTAAIVQHKLGIAGCPAFDVQAVCSGFVYALTVADAMIATAPPRARW
jgi:hypothetical protein